MSNPLGIVKKEQVKAMREQVATEGVTLRGKK